MQKIKIGLVGCGRIAENHYKAIANNGDYCELVALCDNDSEKLTKATKAQNVQGFDNIHDLCQKSHADVVVLTTPSGIHAAQTIICADHKKHVITEKPMATKWQDGLDMVNACDKNGVNLYVVKQNRFNKTLQYLKNAVAQKRFGRIYMVQINVFWQRDQAYYDAAKWRGTWEFDGGAFMNQASHYFDLLDWLIGPVESVYAQYSTMARNIEVEDTGVCLVKWRNGTLGSVNVTMCTYDKNLEGSITILGEKGTARIGGLAVNEILEWRFSDSRPEDEQIKEANYQTTSVYGFGHPIYYQNVLGHLRGECEAYTDGREGLKTLEILIAAYLSGRENKKISLPLRL